MMEVYSLHSAVSFRTVLSRNIFKSNSKIFSEPVNTDGESSKTEEVSTISASIWATLGDGSEPVVRKGIAVLSSLLGTFLFVSQQSQPVSGIALLHQMEKESITVNDALCNGKPTVIEFYADWCESCKTLAPSMRNVENKYKNNVNFITLDGMKASNQDLLRTFKVDGIPHLAFITKDIQVKTSLVGAVPQTILSQEVKALAQDKPLPYEGYDAFEEESHYPFGTVANACSFKSGQ